MEQLRHCLNAYLDIKWNDCVTFLDFYGPILVYRLSFNCVIVKKLR
jgi:hypothetical protein